MPDGLSFFDVVQREAQVITRRRKFIAQGRLAADRHHPPAEDVITAKFAPGGAAMEVAQARDKVEPSKALTDERGKPVPTIDSASEIVGLALSGGGVRSAAFCLGVLQGLDSINAELFLAYRRIKRNA